MAIVLVVAMMAALVGGATMAWFTHQAEGGKAIFTAGTVEVSAGNAVITGTGSHDNWNPGDCNQVKWVIKNTGSKTSYIRVRLDKGWENGDVQCQIETAWSEGTRFGGGWAQYFYTQKGQQKSVRFLAGQHHEAGTITVWNDEEFIFVRFDTINGWEMQKTHLYVGSNPPTRHAPGQLGRKNENLDDPTTDLYKIPIGEVTGDTIYVAAHADVTRCVGDLSDCNVRWELCEDSQGKWILGKDGYYYYFEPVAAGQEIKICFNVCLDGEKTDNKFQGKRFIANIIVDSVQSSHGAIHEVWPSNPIYK